jgi:transmembrane sensor
MTTDSDVKRTRIATEAAEWFTYMRDGELTDADKKRFDQWLAESPVHVHEYLGIAEVWGGLHAGQAWPEQSTQNAVDVVRAAARAQAALIRDTEFLSEGVAGRGVSDLQSRPRRLIPLAIAASIVLLIAAGLFLHWRSDTHTFVTGRGEQRSIVLSDGSVVQLNTLSKVVIQFDSARRSVRLPEGEAFFRVAHDAVRPFEVATPFTTVRAVGTEFNVYNHADSTRVAVIEGKVLVGGDTNSRTQAPVELTADEQITVSEVSRDQPTPVKNKVATAWIQRRIILDNDRLDTALEEFNRYNKKTMQVGDASIATLRISGVFNADDPGALLKYLQRIQGIEARPVAGKLVLYRVNPTP